MIFGVKYDQNIFSTSFLRSCNLTPYIYLWTPVPYPSHPSFHSLTMTLLFLLFQGYSNSFPSTYRLSQLSTWLWQPSYYTAVTQTFTFPSQGKHYFWLCGPIKSVDCLCRRWCHKAIDSRDEWVPLTSHRLSASLCSFGLEPSPVLSLSLAQLGALFYGQRMGDTRPQVLQASSMPFQ